MSPNNLVKNGGFECGLAPWTAGDATNTTHKLGTSGEASNTAFEFIQVDEEGERATNYTPSFVTQDVSGLTPGAGYVLSYSVYFDACSNTGFLGVMINNRPFSSYASCDFGGAAADRFAPVKLSFTASVATEQVGFEFAASRPGAIIKVDNVAVTPA